MIAEWYIERDPWSYMKELIETKGYGETLAISIQCVCPGGTLDQVIAKWQMNLAALFGSPKSWDMQTAENVCSILATYGNGTLARIFMDESDQQGFENIEVVMKKALIIWKPDVHVLSVLHSKEAHLIDYQNPYAASLEAIER
jgi:hypothetical protein